MGKVNEQNIYIKNCKIEINGIAHVEKFCKKILLISRKVQQMISMSLITHLYRKYYRVKKKKQNKRTLLNMLDKKKLELLVGKREPVLLEMVTSPFKTFCSLINKSFLASLNECFFF